MEKQFIRLTDKEGNPLIFNKDNIVDVMTGGGRTFIFTTISGALGYREVRESIEEVSKLLNG